MIVLEESLDVPPTPLDIPTPVHTPPTPASGIWWSSLETYPTPVDRQTPVKTLSSRNEFFSDLVFQRKLSAFSNYNVHDGTMASFQKWLYKMVT